MFSPLQINLTLASQPSLPATHPSPVCTENLAKVAVSKHFQGFKNSSSILPSPSPALKAGRVILVPSFPLWHLSSCFLACCCQPLSLHPTLALHLPWVPFVTFVFHKWLPLWDCIIVLSPVPLFPTYITEFILPFLWGLYFSQPPSVCHFNPLPCSVLHRSLPGPICRKTFPITFSSSANSSHLYWYSIHSSFKIHLGCFCFIIAMIWIAVGVVFHQSHWVPQKSLHCCLWSFPSFLVSNAPESFSKKWDCTLCGSCLLTISPIVQVTLVFFFSYGPTTL